MPEFPAEAAESAPPERWHAILEAMDADLAAANSSAAWTEPTNHAASDGWPANALPDELRSRALEIHAAQGETIRQLKMHLDQVGRHIAALRSIPTERGGNPPAYLDVSG